MNRYATKISSTDENLLNFSDYSFNFFKESSYKKTYRNAILNLVEDFEDKYAKKHIFRGISFHLIIYDMVK